MAASPPLPDLSSRPFAASVERAVPVSPEALFAAWTERFDEWFAEPGAIRMAAEAGAPYFFETFHEGRRHPHYGRFLRVEADRLIELTWMNEAGTRGVETVLTVELVPEADGTRMRLTHAGFRDEITAAEHEAAWRSLIEERLAPLVRERPAGLR
ncbi:hypothetical protein GCM10029978_055510 [Actinoallomurus acanthiterrae]